MAPSLAVASTLLLLWTHVIESKYVQAGSCSNSETCQYLYSATLAKTMGRVQSEALVSTVVKAQCESVGIFNDLKASRVCIQLEKTTISQEGQDEKENQAASQMANELLSKPFCFIQTSDGKVVSVQHERTEQASVVNFKRGIAAAFQGNFKRTAREVEVDTNSKHVSQYRYDTIGEDHVIMYRTVDFDNVIQFASGDPNDRPVGLQKYEAIEYKRGIMQSSSGTMKVVMTGPVRHYYFNDEAETSSDNKPLMYDESFESDELFGVGKYSLKLQKCYAKASVSRRSVSSLLLTESGILATIDNGDYDNAEYSKLRQQFPSIRPLLLNLHNNFSDTQSRTLIRKVLKLESQGRTVPDLAPAFTEVMNYINLISNSTDEKDKEMRALLYSFLSTEGNIDSHKALLNAIQDSKDQKERNTLIVQLAFASKVHPDTLSQIESLISSSNDTTDTLILSYGALASSLSPDLQNRIVNFLENHIDQTTEPPVLIHYIHSLGNSRSQMARRILLRLLATHKDPNVQMAAVYALRYSTNSMEVQQAFLHVLGSDPSETLAQTVLRSLIAGTESEVHPLNEDLFQAIVNAANRNETELKALLDYYVHLLGPKAANMSSAFQLAHHVKRDTSWDESRDEYNVVENLDARRYDVSTYPDNEAYIWGKQFGPPVLNLAFGYGGFIGFRDGDNPGGFKLSAKGVARAQAFGYTKTFFELVLSSENKPGDEEVNNKMYFNIAGHVLINHNNQAQLCKEWTLPLYRSPDYTLLSVQKMIPIYVGFLKFGISLSTNLEIQATLGACLGESSSAKGVLGPSTTVTATAHESGSILETVMGGIELSASFKYQVALQLEGKYSPHNSPARFCMSVLHGWPDNRVGIHLFYQRRHTKFCRHYISLPCGKRICHRRINFPCGVKMCRKRWGKSYPCAVKQCTRDIKFVCGIKMCREEKNQPCGFEWGRKQRWEKGSVEWRLGGTSLTTLFNKCPKEGVDDP